MINKQANNFTDFLKYITSRARVTTATTPAGTTEPGSWTTIPVVPSLLALLGLGTSVGGYTLAHKALQSERQHKLDKQLHQAEQDFSAIISNNKQASYRHINTLDDLCTYIEKVAQPLPLPQASNEKHALGAYLLLATLLSGAGALGSYKYFSARSPNKVLQEAMKYKALQQAQARPPEIYLDSPGKQVAQEEPEKV